MKGLQWLVGFACLGVGWGVVALPLLFAALKRGRQAPERASRASVPWSLGVGVWSGLALGVAAFLWGASIPSEDAGAAAVLAFSFTCFVGGPLAALVAWRVVVTRSRAPAQRAEAPGPLSAETAARELASATRLRRVSVGALVVGGVSSLSGLVLSFSIGLISLSLAMVVVRPAAMLFVVVHLGLAAACLRSAGQASSATARAQAKGGLAVNASGLLLASLIALVGPGFFHELLDTGAKALGR